MNKEINFEELWIESYDNDGNMVWELPYPLTDEYGTVYIRYRICQKLKDDEIFYVDDSSEELKDGRTDGWWSLGDAKKDIENKYKADIVVVDEYTDAQLVDKGFKFDCLFYKKPDEWETSYYIRIVDEIRVFLLTFKELYNRKPIVKSFRIGIEIPSDSYNIMGLYLPMERDWTIENNRIILELK